MKLFPTLLFFFFLFLNNIYCQQAETLTEISNFGSNPVNLRMFIHCNIAKDTNKIPLVVVLHGCGEIANNVAELSRWNKLADLNNFIVLYPQQKFANNPDLCFNWFTERNIEKGKGECESIFQIIAYTRLHYAIDSNSICIAGISSGTSMSVVMAATYPGLFSHAAIFAGEAYKIAEIL
jgi:poly(hydroxyalkanoate) depolymerase family esterase